MSDEIIFDAKQRAVALERRDALLDEAREFERQARAKRAAAAILTRTWRLNDE